MEFVQSKRDGQLAVITMSRAKANAINDQVTDELISAISQAADDDDVRGLVLASGVPKFFSAGLDVSTVFQYDRPRMTEFFAQFIDLYELMFNITKPLVAAVSGHAYAGGAVLGLACQERVMAEGQFGFALNEINLGVVVAPGMIRMARHAVGERYAYEMAVCGRTFDPALALKSGLAAEVVAAEEVLPRAVERARALAAKPPEAFNAVRRLFLKTTGASGASDREWLPEFIDHWFSNEALALRNALAASLTR
jgi:enoyl-CoA hydratase/carnithine racemase